MSKSEDVLSSLKLSGWTVGMLGNTLMMYPPRYKILVMGSVGALDGTTSDVEDILEYLDCGYVGSCTGCKDTRLYDMFNVEIIEDSK